MKLKVVLALDDDEIMNLPHGEGIYKDYVQKEYDSWNDSRLLLENMEIFYYIDIEQMPTKESSVFTHFGICEIIEIYYDLTGNKENEIIVQEK